jgi:phage/conjugal plasmid C-4 type zinc finger TraR family protein
MDEIDFATERAESFTASALRTVLDRMDAPLSNGVCHACGMQIEAARLAANPRARLCMDCADDEEANRRRNLRCGPR